VFAGLRTHGEQMMTRSPLDQPELASFAWARYRRLMRWMALMSFGATALVLVLLYASDGIVSIHFYIATALGVGVAAMLMAALMGLVFLSSATGHDEAIVEPPADEGE
jgi:hypothetical protein